MKGDEKNLLYSKFPFPAGLFRNVIAIGGTPLNSQYFQSTPVESARELVSRFECSYEDFGELVNCLRKVDVEKLVKEVNNMFVSHNSRIRNTMLFL